MSPRDKRPSPAQAADSLRAAQADAAEVGDTYSITYERHVSKPLWRLRERSVVKGKTFEQATEWREFARFSPELLMARGRQQAFLFPQFGARVPQLVRGG